MSSRRAAGVVALLHYSSAPIVGGVQTVMEEQARVLQAHGHRVRLISGIGAERPAGVDFVRIPGMCSAGIDIVGQDEQRLRDALAEVLRDADAVIAHNLFTFHLNMPLTAALWQIAHEAPPRQRWIAWTHDLAVGNPDADLTHLDAGSRSLLSTAHPRCRYVAVSAQRRDELLRVLGLQRDAVAVAPNPVDPLALAGASRRLRELAQERRWTGAFPLVLYPTRVIPRKRLELAVEAVARLCKTRQATHLIVTGGRNPHLPSSAEAHAAATAAVRRCGLDRHVTFIGDAWEPEFSEVAALYHLCDMLLFTSRAEGFGIPVIEAILARMPIVCTDIEPLRRILPADAARFPADADAETVAMTIDAALRASTSVRAAFDVRQRFSPDALYERCLLPLIEGRIPAGEEEDPRPDAEAQGAEGAMKRVS